MSDGVKQGPIAHAATALDSEPALTTPGTPREDKVVRELEANALEIDAFLGGRYRIVRFIARGGMGEVYEGFDEELRVHVAIVLGKRDEAIKRLLSK